MLKVLKKPAQLRTDEMYTEDGVVAIRITPNAGYLKNVTSGRIINIHSRILVFGA